MIELVKFKAEHMREVLPKDRAAQMCGYLSESQMALLERQDHSFTGLVDGKIIGCAGIVKYWEGRGEAWAAFDPNVSRRLFCEVRAIVYRMFEIAPFRRIEAVIVKGFEPGCRFAESLGFKVEAPLLKGYFPGGVDAVLYART